MPLSGGVYTAPAGTKGVPGATIESSKYNALIDDLVAVLSSLVARDGQSALTGNLPAGSNKITGLGAGTADGDSVRYEQIKALLGTLAETELTISSGSVTAVGALHTIDTESDAAADDLANVVLTAVPAGALLLLRAAADARVVTVKHEAGGSGQLSMLDGADTTLTEREIIIFVRSGTTWYERGRLESSSYSLPELSSDPTTDADRGRIYRTSAGLRYRPPSNGTAVEIPTGPRLPGALLQTSTLSGASEGLLTTGIDSTYSVYEVVFSVYGSVAADLQLQVSLDGGSTYKSGAGNYAHRRQIPNSNTGESAGGSNSDTKIVLGTYAANVGRPLQGCLRIYLPSSSQIKSIDWKATNWTGTSMNGYDGHGMYIADGGAIDALRFFAASGTMTGTLKLYGIR